MCKGCAPVHFIEQRWRDSDHLFYAQLIPTLNLPLCFPSSIIKQYIYNQIIKIWCSYLKIVAGSDGKQGVNNDGLIVIRSARTPTQQWKGLWARFFHCSTLFCPQTCVIAKILFKKLNKQVEGKIKSFTLDQGPKNKSKGIAKKS